MHKLLIVLTRGRTGSTPLVADIDQHPDVECHQELFRTSPRVSPYDRVDSFVVASDASAGLTARQYLDDVASLSTKPVLGFKLLISHLDERPEQTGLRSLLMGGEAPVVFLTRDPKTAAISAGIAKARGAYNLHEPTADDAYREAISRKVIVDPLFVKDEVRYYTYWAQQWLASLQTNGVPHVHITYEDYSRDRLATLNTVFRFLDIPPLKKLSINPFSRVTSPVVWDDIINADEVREALGD